jgi:hypothetical protein
MHIDSFARAQPRDAGSCVGRDRIYPAPANLFRILALCFVVLAAAVGCTAKLVPDYNKTIVDGLAKVNEDAMTLFASTSGGTTKATFVRREATYDALIGKVGALRLEAATRPTPEASDVVSRIVTGATGGGARPKDAPQVSTSEEVLTKLVGIFTLMRDTDKAQGLKFEWVRDFKKEFEIYMHQVLTLERAFQR